MTLRLSEDQHARLMDIAHSLTKERRQRVSIHSLLLEGVEMVLKRHGAG